MCNSSSEENGIRYIPKDRNPPAVASLRPIEDYWSALKKAVYDGGWEADNFDALERRISVKAQQTPIETIVKLFHAVRERMRLCAENGYWKIHR